MPIAASGRPWKARVSLVGIVLLAASLGTLAGDRYLQARRATLGLLEASRVDDSWIDPGSSMPGRMPLAEGGTAPDLDLPALGDGEPFHLAGHRGVDPVVLVFGSFSCDLFQPQISELGRIARRHEGRVAFAFIAVREAGHRVPGYEFLLDESEGATREGASERRRRRVGRAVALSGLTLPAYLDLPDESASLAYRAWPRRLVVVDREGRIAHDFGSSLDRPWDLDRLDRLLDAQESGEVVPPRQRGVSATPD